MSELKAVLAQQESQKRTADDMANKITSTVDRKLNALHQRLQGSLQEHVTRVVATEVRPGGATGRAFVN